MGKRVRVGNTNAAILNGEMDLSVWGDEELVRGYRKDKNGRWSGRPPTIVPRAIHDELVKRRLAQAGEMLRESLVDAVVLLRTVVTDEEAQYSDRIKAAALIMDRVMGKAPDKLTVEIEPLWAQALRTAVVPIGIVNNAHDVINV